MTTSSPKSFNYMALRGAEVDDMEFIEEFNLDPTLAYTPQINGAMLDMSANDNVNAGMDPKMANKKRMDAERNIKQLMAKRK